MKAQVLIETSLITSENKVQPVSMIEGKASFSDSGKTTFSQATHHWQILDYTPLEWPYI